MNRSAVYRARPRDIPENEIAPKPSESERALSPEERETVMGILNSERFVDQSPREIYATLLDEGIYLCSWRTMYRLLSEYGEVRERRNQLVHPEYHKPELLATQPRQLWSWDISKLRGPATWTYYYLYMIIDVYSRFIVGWMVMEKESALLAEELIAETCAKENILPGQLTLHADRGSSMTSKTVAQLLMDLGVVKTHSRPYVSNDNPYSESGFKTLKYRPGYPDRFGSLEDSRSWVRPFVDWYNFEHHHSGLGLLTPADVHFGRVEQIREERARVLQQAYDAHPKRFVKGLPVPPEIPEAAWINPPPGKGSKQAQKEEEIIINIP